jgi:hypothetical protein
MNRALVLCFCKGAPAHLIADRQFSVDLAGFGVVAVSQRA